MTYYIWAQGRWAFSTKPDAESVINALDMAYEQRGKPQQVLFHSDQGSSTPAACFGSGCDAIGWNRA